VRHQEPRTPSAAIIRLVNADHWSDARDRLVEAGLPRIAAELPNAVFVAAQERHHPLHELIFTANAATSPGAVLVDSALSETTIWLASSHGRGERGWWSRLLRKLASDPGNASGALAEIRALGCLLQSRESPAGGFDVHRMPVDGRGADFVVCHNGIEVHVEVATLRINDDELERQLDLDEHEEALLIQAKAAAENHLKESGASRCTATATATWNSSKLRRHSVEVTAMRNESGEVSAFSFAARLVQPFGPVKMGSTAHTIASRIAGRKPAGQIPADRPGILWFDLADPSWTFNVNDAHPVKVFPKGTNLASTPGIWHSFYGVAGKTPVFERSAVALEFGEEHPQWQPQHFNGRFRSAEGRCWSAAVLRCINGLVVFEHPDPTIRLPLPILRQLAALPGYSVEASLHRYGDDDVSDLNVRLEQSDRMLRFFAS
jgi:hypothetical protein